MARRFKVTEKFFDITWTTPVKPQIGESPTFTEDNFRRSRRSIRIRRPNKDEDDLSMDRDSVQDNHSFVFQIKAKSQSDLDAIIEKIRDISRDFVPDTDYSVLSVGAEEQEEASTLFIATIPILATLTGKLV